MDVRREPLDVARSTPHTAVETADPVARLTAELVRCQAALQVAQRELERLRASHWRARQLALHDGLTALPNRNFFQQRMAQALLGHRTALPPPTAALPQRAQPAGATQRVSGLAVQPAPGDWAEPGESAKSAKSAESAERAVLAVLVLDLDGFKSINDRHGHAAGDELLRIVGARLQRAVRGQDMVCRLGGDEFACMLGNLPGRLQLSHLADKLIDTVAAPVCIDGLQLSVRPSIGIARCPADGDNTNTLLRHADAAMYRAKRQQLGHAFFDALCDA